MPIPHLPPNTIDNPHAHHSAIPSSTIASHSTQYVSLAATFSSVTFLTIYHSPDQSVLPLARRPHSSSLPTLSFRRMDAVCLFHGAKHQTSEARHFRRHIRQYNCSFAFTSFRSNDGDANLHGRGPWTVWTWKTGYQLYQHVHSKTNQTMSCVFKMLEYDILDLTCELLSTCAYFYVDADSAN
jgi:hypothetical protein